MSGVFAHRIIVTEDSVDENGHVNNLEYIRWMLEAAALHCDLKAWPADRCRAMGAAWVVRSHFVEYLAAGFAGDEIVIQTWVADFGRIRSRRRFGLVRAGDQAVLVRAETQWVFVDLETGRPRAIPTELMEAFEVVPAAQEP